MKRCWLTVLGAPCLVALLSTVPLPGQAAQTKAAPSKAAPSKKEAPAQPTASPAAADTAGSRTRSLGTIGAWSAYASGEKPGRICYLVGRPQKADSAGVARKPPVAMVTHRPSENISNVVSFVEGYPLKTGSDVALEVDDKKFDLFTNDDSAWARTADLDRTIVSTLAKGRIATVRGTANSGKPTTDTYSLAGFGKALALIDEACGISRPETAIAQTAVAPGTAVPQKVSAPQKASPPKKAAVRKASHGHRKAANGKKSHPARH